MPQRTLDLLAKAARSNLDDPFRSYGIVHLPAQGQVLVCGDIHGNQRNLERIIRFADLARYADRHVILQEIIHGGPLGEAGACLSYRVLLEAVRFKMAFPERVHMIMANHDTSFICETDVMKDGREMNRAMLEGIRNEFSSAWPDVREAIKDFLFSQPLGARLPQRIWISHSLPSDRSLSTFDPGVLQRPMDIVDCRKGGSAYALTWGRNMSKATLDAMAKTLDCDLFIVGHQPQPQGWAQAGENLLILASDHSHGCIALLDLATAYSMDALIKTLIPLSSLE